MTNHKALLRILMQTISLVVNKKCALNGLLLDFDEKAIVASDAKILIVIKNDELSGEGKVIVPFETVNEVYKKANKNSLIRYTQNAIFVNGEEIKFKPLEERYPDYKKVIPEDVCESQTGQFSFYKSVYISLIEQIQDAMKQEFTFQLPSSHLGALRGKLGEKVVVVLMPYDASISNTHY